MKKLSAINLKESMSGRRMSFKVRDTVIIGKTIVEDEYWMGSTVVRVEGINGTILLNGDTPISIFGDDLV